MSDVYLGHIVIALFYGVFISMVCLISICLWRFELVI